ncbi:hypothetical protein BCR42DRAFT_418554 [Absidia repens]|uniref:Transcription factor domain-containing protein n=1 Tax=Absidia repens TaxID=90262 RepID=A0A1X2IC89_9FUNG|nr:hypothetical protein BCR42DRAFT_418554 [Absidia repens]
MELILGSFNGVMIQGKRPRRPKVRKGLGGRAPSLSLKPPDDQPAPRRLRSPQQSSKDVPTEQQNASPSDVPIDLEASPIQLDHYTANGDSIDSADLTIDNIVQRLDSSSNARWTIDQYDNQQYRINIHSMQDITDFIHTLGQLSLHSSMQSQVMDLKYLSQPSLFRYGKSNTIGGSTATSDELQVQKWEPMNLPYIHFHSELYAQTTFMANQEWPRFVSILPVLLDDCVHRFITCMNHYFPVRPKRLLVQWYSSLFDPASDPLVLSIASFWVRHVFIHHPMAQLKHLFDPTILDTVQSKLARMAREALAECFDEPHVHHIYALCLCNMTTALPLEQKATNHMLAVRMAAALDIKPLRATTTTTTTVPLDDDQAELNSRLWWYLFQIDHFLTESGTISCSGLDPPSDDYEALSKLRLPTVCSLDETDEIAGVHVWSNVLKIWMIRRRITMTIESVDPDDENTLAKLYDHALEEIGQWSKELPSMLQPDVALDPEHFSNLAEACLTVSMERCTDVALISLRLLPRDGRVLTQLQRRAVMTMIDSSIELITTRQSVVAFTRCQTWPGDLKRSVEMLMSCLKYGDSVVTSRSRIGLMRAARMLRSMAEVRWHDHICTAMLTKIEQILSVADNDIIQEHHQQQEQQERQQQRQLQESTEGISPPFTNFIMDSTNMPVDGNNNEPAQNTNDNDVSVDDFSLTGLNTNDAIANSSIKTNGKSTTTSSPSMQPQQRQQKQKRFIPATSRQKSSIKISNNLYEGVMMLDRDMQPRSQYYNPNITTPHDMFDDLMVFEDVQQYATD